MNYWYVARPNELFLDIDNASKSLKHARARLQGAIECGKLDVTNVMQRPSRGNDHIHVIITLNENLWRPAERYAWEIILHSDIYRSACNIMRNVKAINSGDILISGFDRFETTEFLRMHDLFCDCESKHNAKIMQFCPAAKLARGDMRNAGFFGKPSKNPCTIWPEL